MGGEDEILALIDAIYEAAFDSTLWARALTRLTDTLGTAQIGLLKLDRHAHTFDSIAPCTDPSMDAVFKKYWAFHNPLLPRAIARRAGEIFMLDSLIPREEFVTSAFFNEWMRPAKFGIASMGANLVVGNEVSIMITVANAPGKDEITSEQVHVFNSALPHINRALNIHRELRMRDLGHNAAPDQLERLPRGVMLVDGAGRLLFANGAARTLLDSGRGLTISSGCLRGIGRLGCLARIDRLMRAKGLHPEWPRRTNVASPRPELVTLTRDGSGSIQSD
jgi:hypothetical protein